MSLDDAAYCRRIVRTHARTFWLASWFLPPQKRRAAYALYGFCRVVDDLVDLAPAGRTAEVAGMLAGYRSKLADALAGRPDGPVFRELTRAVRGYRVPAAVVHELLEGVARDCAPIRHESWADLAQYCEGVASSVGEMCMHVFGVPGDASRRARALHHARTLGLAMQLTNVLRDVGEDARNGRCYLPEDELARFGLTRAEVLRCELGADPRWHAFMIHQIARARALYDEAMPGIALLAPDTRRCAMACAVGYASILGAIEANGYDTFRKRARLGHLARAAVLWTAWRAPRTAVTPVPTSAAAMCTRTSAPAELVKSA
jgi:15-cis-phytoene synthase